MAPTPITSNSMRQHPVAHLALGLYAMLVGLVYMLPFLLNARAPEVDHFLPNLFFGPAFSLVGSSWALLHLTDVGVQRWLSRTIALVNPLVAVLGSWLVSLAGVDGIRGLAVIIWADAAIFLVVGLFMLRGHQQWHIAGKATLLAIAGAGSVFLVYLLFGSRYYAFGETVSSFPPYVDLPIIGLTLIVGIGIFLLGWHWNHNRHIDIPRA